MNLSFPFRSLLAMSALAVACQLPAQSARVESLKKRLEAAVELLGRDDLSAKDREAAILRLKAALARMNADEQDEVRTLRQGEVQAKVREKLEEASRTLKEAAFDANVKGDLHRALVVLRDAEVRAVEAEKAVKALEGQKAQVGRLLKVTEQAAKEAKAAQGAMKAAQEAQEGQKVAKRMALGRLLDVNAPTPAPAPKAKAHIDQRFAAPVRNDDDDDGGKGDLVDAVKDIGQELRKIRKLMERIHERLDDEDDDDGHHGLRVIGGVEPSQFQFQWRAAEDEAVGKGGGGKVGGITVEKARNLDRVFETLKTTAPQIRYQVLEKDAEVKAKADAKAKGVRRIRVNSTTPAKAQYYIKRGNAEAEAPIAIGGIEEIVDPVVIEVEAIETPDIVEEVEEVELPIHVEFEEVEEVPDVIEVKEVEKVEVAPPARIRRRGATSMQAPAAQPAPEAPAVAPTPFAPHVPVPPHAPHAPAVIRAGFGR